MPFKRRTGKKKLNPQYVEDPSTRNNFELITDNIDEIFRRLNKQRWVASESTGLGYGIVGTGLVKPPMLKVKLDCTGKNPVIVCLRQKTELVNAVVVPAGISIDNAITSGGIANFLIGNVTRQAIIHAVSLGGFTNTPVAPIGYQAKYPASAVFAFETEPVVGINEFEIFAACGTADEAITLTDIELFAVELF